MRHARVFGLVGLAAVATMAVAFAQTTVVPVEEEAPVQIAPEHLTWHGEGEAGHPVVADVEYWMDEALRHQCGFAAAGAPWGDPTATALWRPTGRA